MIARRTIARGLGSLALVYGVACLVFARRHPRATLGDGEARGPLPAGVFPEGFLWGTATSAHQIDGSAGLSDWSAFEAEPGRIARGDRSGEATGHVRHVADDTARMVHLGANSYRMSIEWARLEPEEGRWDEAAFAAYGEELDGLRRAGIKPMVTLLHFTLPRWLAARGGLVAPDFPARFGAFAGEAARRYGARVALYCTLNEPNVQMVKGYLDGEWPPGVRSPADAVRAFRGLLLGHAAAARAVRERSAAPVGLAINLIAFAPRSRASLLDWVAADQAEAAFNWAFCDAIAQGRARFQAIGFPSLDEPVEGLAGSVDFLGVNYYTRSLIRFSPTAPGLLDRRPGPGPASDLGWEIYPAGLFELLRRAHQRYGLPLYVTENGVADAAGRLRGPFLRAHLHALARALAEGIPVRGYYHWSLLDNFEWAEGFAPRFGLYAVDYATSERRPTEGAEEFARLVAEARRRG